MGEQGTTFYGHTFNGAFSAGSSKRADWFLSSTKEFPQPGKYNPNFYDKPRSSQWKFDIKKRNGPELNLAGAPVGTYNIQEDIQENDHQKYSIGLKLTSDQKKQLIGPSTYKPKLLEKIIAPAYSFSYKNPYKWEKDGAPPPNIYQNNNDEDKQQQTMTNWSLRKSGFSTGKLRNYIPKSIDLGPGQYNPQLKNGPITIAYSIPLAQRNPLKPFNPPGPGTYSTELRHSKSQGSSIGNKYVPVKTSDMETPGPGNYESLPKKNITNTKIGHELRYDIVDKQNLQKPGPGAYDQNVIPDRQSFLQTQSIGISKRPEIANQNTVPGPDTYDLQGSLSGQKYSMGIKLQNKKNDQLPGPGQYHPDDVKDKQPYHYTVAQISSPAIGKSNRSQPEYSKLKNVGPGTYNLNNTRVSGLKISMGKASRFKEQEMDDVGPGSYQIPDTIGKIPIYHFKDINLNKFLSIQEQEIKLKSKSVKKM